MTISTNEMKVLKMNLLGGMFAYLKERSEDAYEDFTDHTICHHGEVTETELEWLAEEGWVDTCYAFGNLVRIFGLE